MEQMPPDAPKPEWKLPQDFFGKVAQTALNRANGWDAVADILAPPDAALSTRLREGDLTRVWRESSSWLGDDTHMLTAELMSLDVYTRGAVRRDPETDLEVLRAGYDLLVADDAGVAVPIRELAELIREEAAAWEAENIELGRAERAKQQDFITEFLVPQLPELARRLAGEAEANVWRILGRLILAVLSSDTGRDFQRAVLGEGLGRRRRGAK